ncbi:MAG: tol-pal system protein YbgF [Longimicrobiales bacterium]
MKTNRIRSAARLFLATAAVASMGGCATKGDIRDLQTELRNVAIRQDSLIAQLRQETLSTQDTLRETSDQLFSFRGDIANQLREMSMVLARLEALAGENQRGIIQVRDQLANLRRAPAGPTSGTPTGGTDGALVPGGGDAEQLYNAAMSQFNRGTLSTARIAFEQFLQAHPSHRLAPDAHFRLAEIMVREDRVEDALEAFLDIQSQFPTAAQVPDALYRAALLQIELGDTDDAEATLERIVNTYPDADAAFLAREKLREIG